MEDVARGVLLKARSLHLLHRSSGAAATAVAGAIVSRITRCCSRTEGNSVASNRVSTLLYLALPGIAYMTKYGRVRVR